MKLLIWYPHVTVLENVMQCDIHAANSTSQDIQICTRRILDPTKLSVGLRILLNLKLTTILDIIELKNQYKLEFQFPLVEIGIPIGTSRILDPTGFQFVL
jgi:hypothetical protein